MATHGYCYAVTYCNCVHSCRKEPAQATSPVQEALPLSDAALISEAKLLFETTQSSSGSKTINNYQPPTPLLAKALNWDSAYTHTLSLGKMVMVPVQFTGQVFVQAGNQKVPLSSFTRLFIYTDKKGGKHIEVVIRLPDETYLTTSSENKKFSGTVIVTDWQGNYIKSFKFKPDGSFVYLGAPTFIKGNVDSSTKAANAYRTNELYCYPRTIEGYNMANGERYDWSYTVTSCVDVGSPGGNSDRGEERETDYTESGGGGTGPGDTPQQAIIKNNVNDPCLKNMVNAVINENVAGKINSMIQTVFGGNSILNLTFTDQVPVSSTRDAETASIYSGTHLDEIEIHLKASILSVSSKEYIAATIMHEVLHAYMHYQGISIDSDDGQHSQMVKNYLDTMAGDLQSIFPGMGKDAAYSLAWGGLEGTYYYTHPGGFYLPPYQHEINILYRAHTDGEGRYFGHACNN